MKVKKEMGLVNITSKIERISKKRITIVGKYAHLLAISFAMFVMMSLEYSGIPSLFYQSDEDNPYDQTRKILGLEKREFDSFLDDKITREEFEYYSRNGASEAEKTWFKLWENITIDAPMFELKTAEQLGARRREYRKCEKVIPDLKAQLAPYMPHTKSELTEFNRDLFESLRSRLDQNLDLRKKCKKALNKYKKLQDISTPGLDKEQIKLLRNIQGYQILITLSFSARHDGYSYQLHPEFDIYNTTDSTYYTAIIVCYSKLLNIDLTIVKAIMDMRDKIGDFLPNSRVKENDGLLTSLGYSVVQEGRGGEHIINFRNQTITMTNLLETKSILDQKLSIYKSIMNKMMKEEYCQRYIQTVNARKSSLYLIFMVFASINSLEQLYTRYLNHVFLSETPQRSARHSPLTNRLTEWLKKEQAELSRFSPYDRKFDYIRYILYSFLFFQSFDIYDSLIKDEPIQYLATNLIMFLSAIILIKEYNNRLNEQKDSDLAKIIKQEGNRLASILHLKESEVTYKKGNGTATSLFIVSLTSQDSEHIDLLKNVLSYLKIDSELAPHNKVTTMYIDATGSIELLQLINKTLLAASKINVAAKETESNLKSILNRKKITFNSTLLYKEGFLGKTLSIRTCKTIGESLKINYEFILNKSGAYEYCPEKSTTFSPQDFIIETPNTTSSSNFPTQDQRRTTKTEEELKQETTKNEIKNILKDLSSHHEIRDGEITEFLELSDDSIADIHKHFNKKYQTEDGKDSSAVTDEQDGGCESTRPTKTANPEMSSHDKDELNLKKAADSLIKILFYIFTYDRYGAGQLASLSAGALQETQGNKSAFHWREQLASLETYPQYMPHVNEKVQKNIVDESKKIQRIFENIQNDYTEDDPHNQLNDPKNVLVAISDKILAMLNEGQAKSCNALLATTEQGGSDNLSRPAVEPTKKEKVTSPCRRDDTSESCTPPPSRDPAVTPPKLRRSKSDQQRDAWQMSHKEKFKTIITKMKVAEDKGLRKELIEEWGDLRKSYWDEDGDKLQKEFDNAINHSRRMDKSKPYQKNQGEAGAQQSAQAERRQMTHLFHQLSDDTWLGLFQLACIDLKTSVEKYCKAVAWLTYLNPDMQLEYYPGTKTKSSTHKRRVETLYKHSFLPAVLPELRPKLYSHITEEPKPSAGARKSKLSSVSYEDEFGNILSHYMKDENSDKFYKNIHEAATYVESVIENNPDKNFHQYITFLFIKMINDLHNLNNIQLNKCFKKIYDNKYYKKLLRKVNKKGHDPKASLSTSKQDTTWIEEIESTLKIIKDITSYASTTKTRGKQLSATAALWTPTIADKPANDSSNLDTEANTPAGPGGRLNAKAAKFMPNRPPT